MKQLRFKYTVATSLFFVLWNIRKARRYLAEGDARSDEDCYVMAKKFMDHMRKRSRTSTVYYGKENIPEDGGYVMYSNHQGKYDALGILLGHDAPCRVLWEKGTENRYLAREVCGLLRGQTIDLEDLRDVVKKINAISAEVTEGKRYLIFPEGGYDDNKNEMREFKTGCFACSLRSETPIVPVAIYDSYRSMDTNTFEKVTTEVHYLTPIRYSEYGGMTKAEVAETVRTRIQAKLDEIKERKENRK